MWASLPAVVAFIVIFLAFPANAAPPRGFVGVNVAMWDPNLDTPRVAGLLAGAGITALRYPGGSTSDGYDWTSDKGTDTARFAHLARAIHAVVTMTANYGSGTPQMAAAWVAYCNALPSSHTVIGRDASGRDWKTAGYWATVRASQPLPRDDGLNHLRAGHAAPFDFRNWEIGNECYGSWEYDSHRPAHDPVEYARFVIAAGKLMRAVDPGVRIGVVVTEAGRPVTCQESAIDPTTHHATSEWTPITLSALSSHGFRPDFLAWHHYAQDPGTESDDALFQDQLRWPDIIADLRRQIAAYYPRQRKTIGIACTECNSATFDPGPQTTGDANARYYAQVAPIALSLGVESLIWWDLHNGPNRSGHDTRSSLNRFPYGDYGILGSNERQDQPYPVYYAIQRFARGHPSR